ncbi:hypothetical protein QBC35DRAFT_202618 [Podospora australis]|uniref:Uncharacterized protein n=1 Tax=Podospora australis TaxID=1536484 RepID=A0AAN7APD9_9PEZI|nr:hypothetical protein QBC35DRAFT_202618 [Podospora australis]
MVQISTRSLTLICLISTRFSQYPFQSSGNRAGSSCCQHDVLGAIMETINSGLRLDFVQDAIVWITPWCSKQCTQLTHTMTNLHRPPRAEQSVS